MKHSTLRPIFTQSTYYFASDVYGSYWAQDYIDAFGLLKDVKFLMVLIFTDIWLVQSRSFLLSFFHCTCFSFNAYQTSKSYYSLKKNYLTLHLNEYFLFNFCRQNAFNGHTQRIGLNFSILDTYSLKKVVTQKMLRIHYIFIAFLSFRLFDMLLLIHHENTDVLKNTHDFKILSHILLTIFWICKSNYDLLDSILDVMDAFLRRLVVLPIFSIIYINA